MASCTCVFQQEGSSGVSGSLKITQASDSSSTVIEGQIRGLTAGQKHGISVCTYGDLSEGSASCGNSFNPFGKTHGAPGDDASMRMVGDIGNIVADAAGNAEVKIEDSMVKLYGPHSVIGRSIVLFAGQDDGGKGGQEKSLTTGNPGPRIACGVIGLSA
mmetsp:Transcript_5388/g.12712  ORF Transcript_5388/g.12712 Transcript_5388/m.12712 type:complete len:159 (-) Transcript_5388:1465-1941(-)|eukprot:CAMPEP_0113603408 /NCGR_PEP_ID=MMETSP0017_2-20120614/1262_1 /TAXON_ID=2856 /ORGANISM="Cylindrotheca closterium" /LENGTH=158 /DNA_ID=CAMNT_0000511797 /DNA_START=53 /DNA_END=529 /DNA_ORIENTATION=+ /assembly_acc=CAM_ASM_000147